MRTEAYMITKADILPLLFVIPRQIIIIDQDTWSILWSMRMSIECRQKKWTRRRDTKTDLLRTFFMDALHIISYSTIDQSNCSLTFTWVMFINIQILIVHINNNTIAINLTKHITRIVLLESLELLEYNLLIKLNTKLSKTIY